VIEIAYGLGFKSASDFTRAFRRAYDMAPQDFRAVSRQGSLDAAIGVSACAAVQVSKRCSLNSISAQKLTAHAGATYQAADMGSPVHLINPVTMN
jgi:hypothetical protein